MPTERNPYRLSVPRNTNESTTENVVLDEVSNEFFNGGGTLNSSTSSLSGTFTYDESQDERNYYGCNFSPYILYRNTPINREDSIENSCKQCNEVYKCHPDSKATKTMICWKCYSAQLIKNKIAELSTVFPFGVIVDMKVDINYGTPVLKYVIMKKGIKLYKLVISNFEEIKDEVENNGGTR